MYEADVKLVPLDTRFENIQKIVCYNECLYVLDSGNHRIMVIKDNKAISQIGIIGNNKGEFYYPASLFIDNNSFFYVLDRGNYRVQIMDSRGNYQGNIPDQPRIYGMAVNSKGLILLGQPGLKKLISVYDREGNRISHFGKLTKPSEIYGPDYKKFDKDYLIPMNRIHLAAGENDDIWVAYFHMPFICQYNKEGKLVYEEILSLEGIEKLKEAVWNKISNQEYLTLGMDGFTLTIVINDLVFERKSKKLYVLLGDNQIFVLDTNSKEKYIIKPRIISGAIEKMGISDNGEIFLSFFFSNKLYRLEIKGQKK